MRRSLALNVKLVVAGAFTAGGRAADAIPPSSFGYDPSLPPRSNEAISCTEMRLT